MSRLSSTVTALSIALALAACDRQPAPPAASPATPAVTAPELVKNDVMADPLTSESVKTALEVVGKPVMDAASGQLHVTVKVANNGTRALSGIGKYPVNIGVQILGDDGTVASAGGLADFVRAPLPEIAPGSSADVNVMIPVDPRLDGRSLNLDLVQEGVNWFSAGFGQPALVLGPFKVCGEALCDETGAAL